MRAVAVAELRQNLSKYLMAVQAGEELLITDRGQPVARIVPVADVHARDTHLRKLIRMGVVRARVRALPEDFWKRPKPVDPAGAVLQALLQERAEGR